MLPAGTILVTKGQVLRVSNFSIKLENHIDFESLFMETSVSPNQPSAGCCMNQPPERDVMEAFGRTCAEPR
jgi:hypothetical protein